MTTVFADTFYFIAFLSPSDEAHKQARAFTETYSGKMVTTEWVLTSLLMAWLRLLRGSAV